MSVIEYGTYSENRISLVLKNLKLVSYFCFKQDKSIIEKSNVNVIFLYKHP